MPGTPTEKVHQSDLCVTANYIVATRNGAFAASFTRPTAAQPFVEESLAGTAEEYLRSQNAKLLKQDKILFANKYPGLAVEASTKTPEGLLRLQYVVAKGILYQWGVIGSSAFVDSEDASKFMASFCAGQVMVDRPEAMDKYREGIGPGACRNCLFHQMARSVDKFRDAVILTEDISGRSSAWLERMVRDHEAAGSNPVAPTDFQCQPIVVSSGGLFCLNLDSSCLLANGSNSSTQCRCSSWHSS